MRVSHTASNIWVRSRNCGCLVTWFCYQLIAKPGNKTAAVSWSDPYAYALPLRHRAYEYNAQLVRIRNQWHPPSVSCFTPYVCEGVFLHCLISIHHYHTIISSKIDLRFSCSIHFHHLPQNQTWREYHTTPPCHTVQTSAVVLLGQIYAASYQQRFWWSAPVK